MISSNHLGVQINDESDPLQRVVQSCDVDFFIIASGGPLIVINQRNLKKLVAMDFSRAEFVEYETPDLVILRNLRI